MASDCQECGAKCCRGIGIPSIYVPTAHHNGVPIGAFGDTPDMRKYLSWHDGIDVVDGVVTISPRIRVSTVVSRRFGGRIGIIHSQCLMLDDETAECNVYENRPDVCRSYGTDGLDGYLVFLGCKYDVDGELGEDYGL